MTRKIWVKSAGKCPFHDTQNVLQWAVACWCNSPFDDTNICLISAFLRNIINQAFCIFPSEAWVCNRAARSHVVADVLAAFEEVAFDHNTFNQFLEIRVVVAAVKYFCNDTDLFFVLFVGVRMVGIYNNSRVLEIFFCI